MLGLLRRLDLPRRERLEKDARFVEIDLEPRGCVNLQVDAGGDVEAYAAKNRCDG
jgi:hypothetical protein